MIRTILRRAGGCVRTSALVFPMWLLSAGLVAGCGALDVSDPTRIEEGDLTDGNGAELLRAAALRKLADAAVQGAINSGLLADEFRFDRPAWAAPRQFLEEILDQRTSGEIEARGYDAGDQYKRWQETRLAATVAVPKLRAYGVPGAAEAHIGEMLAVRAFATLHLAENFCPGFPLHEVVDLNPVYGPPLTTDAALERALADFDSAMTYAADSARVLDFARVGRARALLALGRFEEAASVATPVATGYVATGEFLEGAAVNWLGAYTQSGFRAWSEIRSVADKEGGNGLDFLSADDPRVQTVGVTLAVNGVDSIYAVAKYPTQSAPIVLASGIEARLIQAEADLYEGGTAWLTILNDLRATQIAPAMPVLADPGNSAARLDLLFHERAFWLFATGHRLADLRRLVSRYGRPVESVFPTGAYPLGGSYGSNTSIPFPAALETPLNPAVTGCISQ